MSHGAQGDRIAALVRDIEGIPDTLDRLGDATTVDAVRASIAAALRGFERPSRVVMTGLGSSRFAALQAEAALAEAGVDATTLPASSAEQMEPVAGALTVAISNGGRTPETVAAVARAREAGPVIAITRDAGSPLAAAAGAVLALPIEAEESGVAITSFVATIGLLQHLAAELGPARGPETAKSAADARAILATRGAWLAAALEAPGIEEEVAVLAPWSLRGIAEQAALLLREGPRRSATTFETAEWLHTGVYTALPGGVVLLFAGSPADEEVDETVRSRGGRVLRLPIGGGSLVPRAPDPGTQALAGIAAPALLAAELWRTIARDPGDAGMSPSPRYYGA